MHSHHSLSEIEVQRALLRAFSSLKGLLCNDIHAFRLTSKKRFLYGVIHPEDVCDMV